MVINPLQELPSIFQKRIKGHFQNSMGSSALRLSSNQSRELVVSYVGFLPKKIKLSSSKQKLGTIVLQADTSLEEVIISGNLKPVNRLESTIPVEVYSPAFLQQNPSPNLLKGSNSSTGFALKSIVRFATRAIFTSMDWKDPTPLS